MRRRERRELRASVNDGRGVGIVYVVDGYGRVVEAPGAPFGRLGSYEVVGVHTEAEAISAFRAETGYEGP